MTPVYTASGRTRATWTTGCPAGVCTATWNSPSPDSRVSPGGAGRRGCIAMTSAAELLGAPLDGTAPFLDGLAVFGAVVGPRAVNCLASTEPPLDGGFRSYCHCSS